jgi:hypothetical protein
MLRCTNPLLWRALVLPGAPELLQRHLLPAFFGMLRRPNLLPARVLLLRHGVRTDATVAQQWLYPGKKTSFLSGRC